jgi:membrane protein
MRTILRAEHNPRQYGVHCVRDRKNCSKAERLPFAAASSTTLWDKMRAKHRPAKMASPTPATSKPPQSLWNLGGLTPWLLTRNVFKEIRGNDFLGRASELAFDFLFALFPLILFMMSLFGMFASRSAELQNDLLSYFADFLPTAAFQLLRTTATDLATNASGGKLTFGIIVSLWFASGGVVSMISALTLAYRVREARSWFKVRAIALGLTLLISVLLLAALFIVLLSGDFIDWLGAELHLQPVVVLLWKAFQWPTVILFVTVSYSVIYNWGPDLPDPDLKERRWRWISPGSAFGAFLWFLASVGFRIYLRFFNNYTASYGSLGAVMILLVWLYVTGLAFLIGGEINSEIERAMAQIDLE